MSRPLYICNVKNPSEHCLEYCRHGKPHIKEPGIDCNCATEEELCGLSNSKRKIRIKCRNLTKKEMR